jgi:hypothetical protein
MSKRSTSENKRTRSSAKTLEQINTILREHNAYYGRGSGENLRYCINIRLCQSRKVHSAVFESRDCGSKIEKQTAYNPRPSLNPQSCLP